MGPFQDWLHMADDYGATAGCAHGGGLSGRLGSYDERLQEMRRHLRKQQEKQKRNDLRRLNREKEMAHKWVEFQAEERRAREQELRDRLLLLEKSQTGRKGTENGVSARQRGHVTNGGLAGGAGGNGATSAKAEAPASARESVCLAACQRALALAVSETGTTDVPILAADLEAVVSQEPATKKSGAGTLPRLRKKKREEGAVAVPLRAGGAQGEKSIMQQAQEQFQGLCRSVDGRAILELGTRQQRMHREALVKLDQVAVERAEEDADDNGRGEEEQEAEDQQLPPISNDNGHMARKYRLRSMRQITSQVLQCRRKMTIQLKNSLISVSGLGCSSQDQRPQPLDHDEYACDALRRNTSLFHAGNYRASM